MKMPPKLRPFLTPAQWRRLALGNLDPDDQKTVLDCLHAAFKGMEPKEVAKKDLGDVLEMTKSLADAFRVCGDDDDVVTKDDLIAARNTAKDVVRDFKKAKQGRQIVWKEVLEFGLLGHGVQIKHDWVPDTPVAFIAGFDWTKSPQSPATVKILKVAPSFPIRVERTTRSGKRKETLAQNSPAIWKSILQEVKRGVAKVLLKGPNDVFKPSPRTSSIVNG